MIYTAEIVRQKLETDQRWLERALVVLFEFQTRDEQVSETTRCTNNIGFNHADARSLTKPAKWVMSGKSLNGWHLENAKKKVPKYSRQILELIRESAPI